MKTHNILSLSRLLFFTLSLALPLSLHAQVGINSSGADPDSSAMLDVSSTDKGILVPRMTASQRDAIANPATGLAVFVTSDSSFYYFDGTGWEQISNFDNEAFAQSTGLPNSVLHTASLTSIPLNVEVVGNYGYVLRADDSGSFPFPTKFDVYDLSDPNNITWVNTLTPGGNQAVRMDAVASKAVILDGGLYYSIDLSSPASPTLIGSISSSISNTTGIKLYNENTLFLLSAIGGEIEIRRSSPNSVKVLSVGANPNDIAFSGNYAYVANAGNDKLEVIDFSVISSASVVHTVNLGSAPVSVSISGNYAYIANNGNDQLEIVDISDPLNASLVHTVSIGSNPIQVRTHDNYAFVLDESNSLFQIIDISNPTSSYLVKSLNTGGNPSSFDIEGDFAYVATNNNGSYEMQVLTIPSATGFVPLYDLNGNISEYSHVTDFAQKIDLFTLVGNNLELSISGDEGAPKTVDLSGYLDNTDNQSLSLANDSLRLTNGGSVDLSGYLDADNLGNHTATQNMQTNGNWISNDGQNQGLFVDSLGNVGIGTTPPVAKLDVAGSVKITDGTEGAGKVLKSDADGLASWGAFTGSDLPISFQTPCLLFSDSVATDQEPYSVAVSGNYAYVVNRQSNTMQVIDISDPASPTVTGSVTTGISPSSVAVSGIYAYVANRYSGNIKVINISNPASPTVIGSLATGIGPSSLAISGNYVFVVHFNDDNMVVVDVSNPAMPTVIGSVATKRSPSRVAISGNYAYVTCFNVRILDIIDISTPSSPSVTGSVITGYYSNHPTSVAILGNYAYVTRDDMLVIDISNPVSPTIVDSVAVGGRSLSVAVSGSYAFVVNYSSDKLTKIDISNPISPIVIDSLIVGDGPRSVVVSGKYAYVLNGKGNTMDVIDLVSCADDYDIAVNPKTGELTATAPIWDVNGNDINNANAGHVGIGTTSPQDKLHIEGYAPRLRFSQTGTTHDWSIGQNTNSEFSLKYNTLERIVIEQDGEVGIGISSPSAKLHVKDHFAVNGQYVAIIENTKDGAYSNGLLIKAGQKGSSPVINRMIRFENLNGDEMGAIRQAGTTSVSYNTTSDIRLKTNIQPTAYGLADLMQIEVKDYSYKGEERVTRTGFIAQQLFDHYPEPVSKGGEDAKTDPWMVDYGQITPLLVKAIQEQQEQIDLLKSENEVLKAQIEKIRDLEASLNRLQVSLSQGK